METQMETKMETLMNRPWITAALLALFSLVATAAQAQTAAQAWPTKPIKVVVNFPPGGAADQIARAVSQPLQDALGQPVLVENRGGSGGNLGGDAVAKSPADGYTLLMASGSITINPHLYKNRSEERRVGKECC